MRGILTTLGVVFVVFLVVAQFVNINRTNPPIESDVPAPPDVKAALRAACYDCHSNETTWPWYGYVAPMSWLLAYDVSEGREELNFSTWQRYDARKQRKKLKGTVETLTEGEMPPWYYSLMHPDARLANKDRQALIAWANQGAGGAVAAAEPEARATADNITFQAGTHDESVRMKICGLQAAREAAGRGHLGRNGR
jgi:Haem-binding domain